MVVINDCDGYDYLLVYKKYENANGFVLLAAIAFKSIHTFYDEFLSEATLFLTKSLTILINNILTSCLTLNSGLVYYVSVIDKAVSSSNLTNTNKGKIIHEKLHGR